MSDDKAESEKIYEVESAANLWPPFTIVVIKGIIVSCSDRNSVTIGSTFTSMNKYWSQFEGENAYVVKPLS